MFSLLSTCRLITVACKVQQMGLSCWRTEECVGRSSGESTHHQGSTSLSRCWIDNGLLMMESIKLSILHPAFLHPSCTVSCASLEQSMSRKMVIKVELKSTNRILAYLPGESRCCRMQCSSVLTALSTDLFAQYANWACDFPCNTSLSKGM